MTIRKYKNYEVNARVLNEKKDRIAILFGSGLSGLGNVLLFVSAGKLMVSNEKAIPITEVEEGYFALLPAEKCHLVTAVTRAETIIMHAGQLSELITEDPEWNPDLPVVLPIFPSLARTLYLLKESQKEKQNSLN